MAAWIKMLHARGIKYRNMQKPIWITLQNISFHGAMLSHSFRMLQHRFVHCCMPG